MPYPVTYHCPRCGTLAELTREGYLRDKTVTPYPLEGWSYADPDGAFEDADGVRIVCGESGTPALTFRPPPAAGGAAEDDADESAAAAGTDSTLDTGAEADGELDGETDEEIDGEADVKTDREADGSGGTVGCGEPFYLSFVRFEDGEEVEPRRPPERVTIASDGPSGPRGPRGPGGPGGPDRP